jgi:hypothetical protein
MIQKVFDYVIHSETGLTTSGDDDHTGSTFIPPVYSPRRRIVSEVAPPSKSIPAGIFTNNADNKLRFI